ncbi:ABC transporter substrate-binding protein [Mucilaginibacter sp.]|uniref:ABC transporter substrate-binding protein n=1 Tax=Mucilaginibacter sp. TaxID=1882438 RepID=UPI00284CC3BA|nr:ABC transporter substrate-binding protein [Mucilaginibacter sp.]MDR3694293.1 ABC transporter substrate-binding protein [Mucilaginibacter sp.]
MTSVVNRLQPLSGNRWFIFLFIALLGAACSPKLQPVAVRPVHKEPEKSTNKAQPEKENKPAAPKTPTIALLLPFGLDHLAPGASYTSSSLHEADIALGYYQGFKLALDSLAGQGYNYKLMVYDTRGDKAQAHSFANNPAIRASDMVVGPVFPDDIKAFTGNFTSMRQPVVSPLSPASPSTYKNQQVITMIPPLEYHAWAAAKYIKEKINPEKVFVLRSGFNEENEYLIPLKKAIDSLGKKHIKIITLTVIHGQLNALLPQLTTTGTNVFIVPATDQHFLSITLRALDSLHNAYPITVFGHPNWVNLSFLKAELLQRLDTYITSSDRINYKADNVVAFMRRYRETYHSEATAFAIKGFDEGMYLGRQLSEGNIKNLAQTDFSGLHNDFKFEKKTGLGLINTHVSVYKYANFELKKVE